MIKSLFKILLFIIASWGLIHILGVLGIFVAIAYPIWWLFMPNQIPCLYCQTHKNDTPCPLCKKNIQKDNVSPANFKSAVSNGILILIITSFSVGFIYVESKILNRFGILTIKETAQFVIPRGGERQVGETFPMDITVNNIQTPINAIQADIKFDPFILEAVEIDTQGSFASILVQKEINNELGYLRISGGLPNPGLNTPQAYVGTVYFKAKAPGTVTVSLLPSSLVMANDGKGSNILKDFASSKYIIVPSNPGEVFPGIGFVKQKSIKNRPALDQLDFTIDGNILGSKDKILNNNQIESKNTLNPLNFIASIDVFILQVWNLY